MPVFATETDVRERFRLTDESLVSDALIERAIEDAHVDVLRVLDPVHDVEPAAEDLVTGEALLAGAHVFRALAAGEAFGAKRVVIGGQRIEEGSRFEMLHATARDAEGRAWELLAPYVLREPARTELHASVTTPILGEE